MGAHILAQVVLPYFTGTPEDVAVNTFHFDEGLMDVKEDPELITTPLSRFYTVAAAPSTLKVGECLSSVLSRDAGAARIRLYYMDDPKPRVPFETFPFTLPTVIGATDGMPNEVAIVNSFQGERVSGLPQARRRGRVFLGPLGKAAFTLGTSSAFPKVNITYANAIVDASKRLFTEAYDNEVRWCVYSRKNNDLVPVRNGWVDSDPDTQRRRENGVRTRTAWTVSV